MKDFQKYIIPENATIKKALIQLNEQSGNVITLFVVNEPGKMLGTLTDGDTRRALITGLNLNTPVSEAMNTNFHFFTKENLDVSKFALFREKNFQLIPCLDNQGHIIEVYDLKRRKTFLPIDAVLMAGGKGERLRPLTERTPKPLLPVGNKTIIDYNIENLIQHGVEHISVTVNYLKEQIEEHFAQPHDDIQIQCVREPQYLGTIGSVRFIETFFHDTILVMNSDLFTNIDFEDFYLHFIENKADMSVAAVPYPVSVPYGIFHLEGNNITGLTEKPTYNYYANAGIYLIKKELLGLIPEETFFNAPDLMELLIEQKKKVIRFPITGFWIDIGKKEDYTKAQEIAKHM